MTLPLAKLKAVILYFCSNTDPESLGKVKLMKLFYFLDFGHVKKYAAPITFDSYVNLPHGPIPSTIKNLVDDVCDDPDSSLLSDVISCEISEGKMIQKIIPKRKFNEEDEKLFSKTELEMLENICTRFGDKTARFVESVSHAEAPWRTTSTLQDIPYKLAILDRDCLVSEEEIDFVTNVYSN